MGQSRDRESIAMALKEVVGKFATLCKVRKGNKDLDILTIAPNEVGGSLITLSEVGWL